MKIVKFLSYMSNVRVSGVTFVGFTRRLCVDGCGDDREILRPSGGDEWTGEDAEIYTRSSSVWEYARDRPGNGDGPKRSAQMLRIWLGGRGVHGGWI